MRKAFTALLSLDESPAATLRAQRSTAASASLRRAASSKEAVATIGAAASFPQHDDALFSKSALRELSSSSFFPSSPISPSSLETSCLANRDSLSNLCWASEFDSLSLAISSCSLRLLSARSDSAPASRSLMVSAILCSACALISSSFCLTSSCILSPLPRSPSSRARRISAAFNSL